VGEGAARGVSPSLVLGVGGGVYIAGGTVCLLNTIVRHQDADASNDNVFGAFTTDC
jgi:hypothetical protein